MFRLYLVYLIFLIASLPCVENAGYILIIKIRIFQLKDVLTMSDSYISMRSFQLFLLYNVCLFVVVVHRKKDHVRSIFRYMSNKQRLKKK